VRYYKGFFNEQQLPRPCNYVSVMETADFSFSTAYLTTTEFWDAGGHGMGDLNEDVRGEQARVDKETPYACVSSNSDCLTNDEGYLCRCYRGNPCEIEWLACLYGSRRKVNIQQVTCGTSHNQGRRNSSRE
jgi:hypothetical protein